MPFAATPADVIKKLSEIFRSKGYVRRVNAVRKTMDGRLYKKGAEVRLIAKSKVELAEVRRLLKRAGFKTARPFAKGNHWRQPVYGVAEVARFLLLVGEG